MAKRQASPVFNFRLLLVIVAGACCTGCGGPNFVSVSGIVTLDGEPVPGAAIAFDPVAPGPLGAAVTDEQGRFTVATSDREGLIAGEYQVSVTKYDVLSFDPSKPGDFSTIKVRWALPQRYSQIATSGLTLNFDDDNEDLRIELHTP